MAVLSTYSADITVRRSVTYIIAQPCVDVKDKSCIEECPVDCIYEGDRMLYIQPDMMFLRNGRNTARLILNFLLRLDPLAVLQS